MSKRGQLRSEKQRDNQYIDQIQSEYLTHRFRRIVGILSKNYVYSFQLMTNLNTLYRSSFHIKVEKIVFVIQSVRYRYSKSVFSYFIRILQRRLQSKQKSCLITFEILQRPITIINSLFFASLSCFRRASKKLSKDKQLFLIITFSNIQKAFNSAKVEAFQAIKYTSRQSRITYNKAKIIALEYLISQLIDIKLQKAFKKIKHARQQIAHFLSEDDENSCDSEQQDIMIESFKSLAFNLKKMKEKEKLGKDIKKVKKQEGAKNMCAALDQVVKAKMKWTLWELSWNCRTEYSPQTYQILSRQIAVLQKQYQST